MHSRRQDVVGARASNGCVLIASLNAPTPLRAGRCLRFAAALRISAIARRGLVRKMHLRASRPKGDYPHPWPRDPALRCLALESRGRVAYARLHSPKRKPCGRIGARHECSFWQRTSKEPAAGRLHDYFAGAVHNATVRTCHALELWTRRSRSSSRRFATDSEGGIRSVRIAVATRASCRRKR